jgi:hypothetical protein
MVKGSIKIARDAHYDAEQRTVGVSLKPAVGKQIIADSLIQAATAAGSFSPCFDSERFIFGKIRAYTLRAASHGNKDAFVAAVPVQQENHSNEDIHESMAYRVAAQVVLDRSFVALEGVPRVLQTHVAAQMMHDAHIAVFSTEKTLQDSQRRDDVREEFQLSSTLRSWARTQGIQLHHKDVQILLNSIAAMASASAASNWDQSSPAGWDGRRPLSAVECAQSSLLFALSLLISRAMKTPNDIASSSHIKSQVDSQRSTQIRTSSSSASKCVSAPWLGLRNESGFGTSPIWYQQSMATGPPPQASRWITTEVTTMNADKSCRSTAFIVFFHITQINEEVSQRGEYK